MKYVAHIFAIVVLGWPAVLAGYAWSVVSGGFKAGRLVAQHHEDAAMEKFLPNTKEQR